MSNSRKPKPVDVLARKLINQESVTRTDTCNIIYEDSESLGHDRAVYVFNRIYGEVSQLDAGTLGRIAASGYGARSVIPPGATSLYLVHKGTWLGKYSAGIDLLRMIAATAIVARMHDILGKQPRS